MSYLDQGQTLAAQPPDAVPQWTWEPMSAAMRRMQVQVRKKQPCVMPPVFCRGGVRHVGLREESTRKSKSFEDLDFGFWRSSDFGTESETPLLQSDRYSRAALRGFRRNGLRAVRLRRHLVARLTTVACSANVIAVSFQRTGSFRSQPVDTGRAFAKPFLLTTLRHRAATNATCPKSESGVARCHAQSESLSIDCEMNYRVERCVSGRAQRKSQPRRPPLRKTQETGLEQFLATRIHRKMYAVPSPLPDRLCSCRLLHIEGQEVAHTVVAGVEPL